jgi:small subunit ribosomal protein S4
MGDPKFPRRKYEAPSHPWEGERMKLEGELVKKYGLKNKRELWKAQSLLRTFRQRSRILQAQSRYQDEQAEQETDELLAKLGRLGILPQEGATLDDVLALDIEAVLSRRLQTIAYVKGLGYTTNHARQLIVHGHIAIGGRKVTIPGYMVKRVEEGQITYHEYSPLAHDMHPARPDVEAEAPAEPEVKPAKEATEPVADKPKKEKPPKEAPKETPPEKPPKEAPKEAPKEEPPEKEVDAKETEASTGEKEE